VSTRRIAFVLVVGLAALGTWLIIGTRTKETAKTVAADVSTPVSAPRAEAAPTAAPTRVARPLTPPPTLPDPDPRAGTVDRKNVFAMGAGETGPSRFERMNLTPEEEAKIRQLQHDFRQKMREARKLPEDLFAANMKEALAEHDQEIKKILGDERAQTWKELLAGDDASISHPEHLKPPAEPASR
jgi:hypothetical protein